MAPLEPEPQTTQVPDLIVSRKDETVLAKQQSKKPIRFVASSRGNGDSIKIYHKGRPFLKFRTSKDRFKSPESCAEQLSREFSFFRAKSKVEVKSLRVPTTTELPFEHDILLFSTENPLPSLKFGYSFNR